LTILGFPSTSLNRTQEWLIRARHDSDSNSITSDLSTGLMYQIVLRDSRMVAERANELLSLGAEHGIAFYDLILVNFVHGWAKASVGRAEEGIAEMRRSISDPTIAESLMTCTMRVALAETCGKNGRVEEGLDLVAKGLATAERIGMKLADAELYRVKGELLIVKDAGKAVEVERCFRTAIEVARGQSARLFELRATVSLARLLRETNRADEARAMLAEIYNWFTEGFDTADLKEAKALLDELSR
jgi:predicted ATPase